MQLPSVRQYCAEIEEAARHRMELIVPEFVKQNGVTGKLKADNQMEWARQMNACKTQAEEIVQFEMIYDRYKKRPDKNIRALFVPAVELFIFF